ncbi:ribonuclease H-like YkuK family protein [Ectobacillus antri]|uniref:Ribonuclease H-like YkuK family protein n=1 Tax=Ectobacillus antri TaxID=2486280 RepID=A0ABT6H067_9BACI|nr:ribonuclease H-like YkuK family protein [Ectobacillus antri]MDG4655764.1 ribonuclease H-like YkuK family protein [Ectobacillus antri]MDG5752439.1 ribonuclease H-like YkuK family protein [Ectobacillus antri]
MEGYRFYNLSEQSMDFNTVFLRIYEFMREDPLHAYRLSIGTDSQTHHDSTRFITAIHLHRIGKGAWGCLRNQTVHRKMESLREKIHLETYFSQEIAYLFTPEHLGLLMELLQPYKEAKFSMEIHLDIGNYGLTKEFILDMTNRVKAMGLVAKIKPDAYAAFSYANRYTK